MSVPNYLSFISYSTSSVSISLPLGQGLVVERMWCCCCTGVWRGYRRARHARRGVLQGQHPHHAAAAWQPHTVDFRHAGERSHLQLPFDPHVVSITLMWHIMLSNLEQDCWQHGKLHWIVHMRYHVPRIESSWESELRSILSSLLPATDISTVIHFMGTAPVVMCCWPCVVDGYWHCIDAGPGRRPARWYRWCEGGWCSWRLEWHFSHLATGDS